MLDVSLPQQMPALAFSEFGGPEKLSVITRPLPKLGAGEVLVRVAYSTINPTDLMMLSGLQAKLMTDLVAPYVAGMEFTGHIAAVGAGVVGLALGAAVLGVINPRLPRGGAHQNFIAVPAASLALLPDEADLAPTAALPMNGLTALLALEQAGLKAGQTLLVTGGTGILGSMVIALAKAMDLQVLAGARPEEKSDLKALGVDHVLPRQEGLVEAVRVILPSGADALIDCALIGARITGALADHAPAISLRMSHLISDPRVRGDYVSVIKGMERSDLLGRVVGAYQSGVLKPKLVPVAPFLLADAPSAFARMLSKTERGRLLIKLG